MSLTHHAFKNVAFILRVYADQRASVIRESVGRAVEANVGLVVVVINAEGATGKQDIQTILADIAQKYGSERLVFVEMEIGYSWANGLNRGFDEVRRRNEIALFAGDPEPFRFVVPVSNEALWDVSHLNALLAEARLPRVGVVGTTFFGQTDEGKPVALGLSYFHPRNTMMAISYQAFREVGYFSPVCDDFGGMEDFYFMASVESRGYQVRQLDLKIPLVVGVHYNQEEKERRELGAMKQIIKYQEMVTARLKSALEELLQAGKK